MIMRKFYFPIGVLAMILILACGSAPETTNAQSLPGLSPLPPSEIQRMREGCTGIDYTFLNPSFSMSLEDSEDILDDLLIIGEQAPEMNPNCKPLAMIFYKSGLDRYYDAELYYDQNCQYIVFTKDGERLYANVLSDMGKENFQAILEYMEEQMNQMRGN
jgi:hypothetical protein